MICFYLESGHQDSHFVWTQKLFDLYAVCEFGLSRHEKPFVMRIANCFIASGVNCEKLIFKL